MSRRNIMLIERCCRVHAVAFVDVDGGLGFVNSDVGVKSSRLRHCDMSKSQTKRHRHAAEH